MGRYALAKKGQDPALCAHSAGNFMMWLFSRRSDATPMKAGIMCSDTRLLSGTQIPGDAGRGRSCDGAITAIQGPESPVEGVSWMDVQEVCEAVNAKGGRLP